ncbi:Ig-like domain-containing protein [Paenibacillus cremeus]|uniref:BIG2 domain-containing protein n=1 Tax=Paenibacillus cremeus TaxID=2163881 RepID=A0A559K9E7_9BACL|nr:Ig-like domain-containing protein [Paenibacillus cremeus]TVY08765.1 hypothetical protein FPZ49_17085 [Paenibacillus cremeus]
MYRLDKKMRLGWLSLVFTLIVSLIAPMQAFAANGDVKGIEFENATPVFLYVEQQTAQLKVLATIEGAEAKKDVTSDAVWVSSAPQVVKVDKGLLTPLGKGNATITAKYKGFTLTLSATSSFLFEELKLSTDTAIDLDLGAPAMEVNAFAVEADGHSYDVSDDAAWTSSNATVATVSNGMIIAVGKGSTTITVKYKGLSDSVKVNVASPYTSLQIEGAAGLELMVGQEDTALKAKAVLTGGSYEEVTDKGTWTTSNTSVLTVEKGKLKAVGAGTAKVAVSYLGVTADTQVIIRLPYQAVIVSPQKDLYMFTSDSPVQLSSFVSNDAISRSEVTLQASWSTSNPMVASVSNGLVSPKAVGKSTIKISYRGLTKELAVTVLPVISKVTIDSEDITLFKDEMRDLPSVNGQDLDEEELDFSPLAEWVSDHEDVAKTVNGKLVAVHPGTAQLTVTMKGFTDTVKVTVQEKVLVVRPEMTNLSIVVGNEVSLPSVKAIFEDGTEQDIGSLITWKPSSPNLLVKEGKLKALLSGKVNLVGTYLNKSVTIPVLLEEPLDGLTVEPGSIELNPGRSQSIRVKGAYADGNEVLLTTKVVWTSSDSSVASAKGSFVKAVGEGTATLTSSYQGKPLSIQVKVVPKLMKLQASDTSVKVKAGETAVVHVQALYDNGAAVDETEEAIWTSSNTYVATVSGGVITGVKKGSATIKATFNKKTVSIRVTVN